MTPTAKTDTVDSEAVQPDRSLPAVATGNGTLAVPDSETVDRFAGSGEWDGVDDGDLAPPEESLLPLIPMNRKMGEGLIDPTTGEKTDTLTFVWLARSMTRAWWAKSFDDRAGDGDPPACRSVDGVHGVGTFGAGSAHNSTGACATCPMNTWDTPLVDGEPHVVDDKGTVARPCNASYEAMVAVPDTADEGTSAAALWRLRFSGLAFGPARAFWNSFTKRVPKIAPIGCLSQMVLEPKDTKNGKFLVPTFTRLRTYRRAEIASLIEARDQLLDEFKRLVAEDAATRTADVDEQDHRVGGTPAGRSTDPNHDEEPF